MILGDFNLTRSPADKNTGSFNLSDATRFNDLISSIALVEIPLVDRAYTWSNRRVNPTLVRLDRCFVNLDWDACFPNTTLSSLTRFASDHVPLLACACTRVPRSVCFRFENSWLLNSQFPMVVQSVLDQPLHGCPAKTFVLRLKRCRTACRSWSRRQRPLVQRGVTLRFSSTPLTFLKKNDRCMPLKLLSVASLCGVCKISALKNLSFGVNVSTLG